MSEDKHQHHEHHQHSGHHDHSEHDQDHHQHHGNFKEIFLKSLPMGIIIMILSPMMGITLPFQFTFQYSDIIVALLSTILLMYGGKPFYQGAVEEFKDKAPGMMALVSLEELLPKDAHLVLEDGSTELRPVTELEIGDIVRGQGGENIPADGTVVKGESRVNEAIFTGESKPVEKNR